MHKITKVSLGSREVVTSAEFPAHLWDNQASHMKCESVVAPSGMIGQDGVSTAGRAKGCNIGGTVMRQ